jgi:ankyrin repeat protein
MAEPTQEQLDHLAAERALRAGRLNELPESLTAHPDYPNVRESYIGTPLIILAISWAPVDCVRQLADAGADVNVEVDDGFPALLGAVMSRRNDRVELVQTLIDLGAHLETPGVNGWTALHAAASQNDVDLVQVLVGAGANREARTGVDDDATPLQEAERAGATEAALELKRGAAK